jgi:hypothetical protein
MGAFDAGAVAPKSVGNFSRNQFGSTLGQLAREGQADRRHAIRPFPGYPLDLGLKVFFDAVFVALLGVKNSLLKLEAS